MNIKYGLNSTKVVDCYKLSNKEIDKIGREIFAKRKLQGLLVTRDANSYASEIRAHKRAYLIGYKRKRTKDADLEENLNKKLEILYKIFGY